MSHLKNLQTAARELGRMQFTNNLGERPSQQQLEQARKRNQTPAARRNHSQKLHDLNAPSVTLPKAPWDDT